MYCGGDVEAGSVKKRVAAMASLPYNENLASVPSLASVLLCVYVATRRSPLVTVSPTE